MTAKGLADNLHWLGHASFRWKGSKTVYFDPYHLAADAAKADIICVTHEHFDHCSKDDLAIIAGKDTVVVANADAAAFIRGAGIACKEIVVMAPGDAQVVSGVEVKAVPSYNTNKSFHTKESQKLGFIVTMDGMSVYDAGDTDVIPEMKDVRCDVALLPVSGTYVMTADEAAQAARVIKPALAIPMHFGDVVGSPEDAKRFHDSLEAAIAVLIPKKES